MARRAAILMFATLMLVAGLTGPAANAKGPMTSPGAIAVDCALPDFPSPANTVVCTVIIGAVAVAFVDDKGDPGVFVAAASGGATGKIVYNEPCIIAGEPPLQGTATGTIIVPGTWLAVKNAPTGHPATLTIVFNWQRTGVAAVITTGKLSGKGNDVLVDNVNGQTATDLVGGVAAGVLVPLGVPASCGDPGPNPLRIAAPAGRLGPS